MNSMGVNYAIAVTAIGRKTVFLHGKDVVRLKAITRSSKTEGITL